MFTKPTFLKSLLLLVALSLLSFSVSWFLVIAPIQKVNMVFQSLPTLIDRNLSTYFPSDLVLKVTQGNVSVNRPSPYCLPLNFDQQVNSKMGLIFDSKISSDYKLLDSVYPGTDCQPLAIVGKNFVMYKNKDGEVRINSIPEDLNYQLDKPTISKFVAEALPVVEKVGRTLYFLAPLLLLPFALVAFLIANLYYAAVLWLVNKILKLNLLVTFGYLYNFSLAFFGLYLFIVNFLLNNIIFKLILPTTFSFSAPFLFSLLLVLFYIYTQKTHPRSPSPLRRGSGPTQKRSLK